MRKLFVAAAVLVLAGVAVAGAVHVKQSLCNGVCPLTGRPIAHHTNSNPSPAAAESTGFSFTVSGDQTPAADGDENVCPKTRRHCCCPSQQKCEPAKPVEQAPIAPTQNP
jgi:hypothetical protein